MTRFRRHRILPVGLAVTVLCLISAACGSASSVSTGNGVASATDSADAVEVLAPPSPVVWSPCPNQTAIQCGSVSVPVDYQHPGRGSITIGVTRAPALDGSAPRGTLVFNPGGPGESGNQILPVALALLPASIRQTFDIVSFDPRGTGASDPLQCGTSPSALTSVDPVSTQAGRPLPGTPVYTAMAQACQRKKPGLEPFITTTSTARDLDRIRQALGLSTISYYGLSYGTALGAVYADLFPRHVATMVLDGAVDVDASLPQQANQQAPAAERSLDHLLGTCASLAPCPLGADPRSYFQGLLASLQRHPLPAPGHGDNYPVTVGDLDTATLFAVSVTEGTGPYYDALVAAHNGNGDQLRSLALEFETDVNGAPLGDPLWAITCNDAAGHSGPLAAGDQARALNKRYPLVGAYAVNYTMGGCVAWPRARQPVAGIHPSGTPPILVVGNTGDPNTPLIGAKHLTAIFPKATLLTWTGWGHTWLLSGSGDTCMQQAVTTYLSGGGLPPAGTVCH
jgi:pimeloyl-ACP methyl ester carboxylesterase